MMEANEQATSAFWRIDIPDMEAADFNADDAQMAGAAIAAVLRRVAMVMNQPLEACVYTYPFTDSYYDSADGVAHRWREPRWFTVHALVRLLGNVRLSENDFCGKLLGAIGGMHPEYLDKYHSWEFMRIDEKAFNDMHEEDLNRAVADDI